MLLMSLTCNQVPSDQPGLKMSLIAELLQHTGCFQTTSIMESPECESDEIKSGQLDVLVLIFKQQGTRQGWQAIRQFCKKCMLAALVLAPAPPYVQH